MSRTGVIHAERAAIVQAVVLAAWLIRPAPALAVLAAAVALVALAGALRRPRPAGMAYAVLLVAGALLAGRATLQVRSVERDWPTVRDRLIETAGARLNAMLLAAVDDARAGAAEGVRLAAGDRDAAFRGLDAATAGGMERGAVVFDGRGRPWAWAGRHRVLPVPDTAALEARMSGFYAVLIARRQSADGASAVAQVTLAADSAVPDRDRTLAAAFGRRTGATLRFFEPGRAPNVRDVFDYCVPSCRVPGADTLFSVQLVPPTQGAHKLGVQEAGDRLVTLFVLALLAVLLAAGRTPTRVAAALVLGGVLVFTPAGLRLPMGDLFSPATYFQDALGPLSSSAGALLVTAGVVLLLTVMLWRVGLHRGPWAFFAAAALLAAAPVALLGLAQGISPPAGGAGIGLWLGWQLAVATACVALLLLAAAFLRGPGAADAPGGITAAAVAWSVVAALVGLFLWRPDGGWPGWYVFLWLPAMVLAVQPARPLRVGATIAVVAASAAALLTWGAAAQGRLLLAERDVAGLRQRGDAIGVGLLERFGERLTELPLPGSAAELYARWSRSALEADGYPAVLVAWHPGGMLAARLDLAALDLPGTVLRDVALAAQQVGEPIVEIHDRVPGAHYVLGVPFPDGSMVTVAIGPRSRAVPPVRVARFLKGEPGLEAPYDISVTAPVADVAVPEAGRLAWQRTGWVARGEERLEVAGAVRHLHVRVPLGSLVPLLVRGALVVVLNGLLLALVWLAADGMLGRLRAPAVLTELVERPTYRVRLAVALAVFFVVPTVGFALWTAQRLAAEAQRSRDLIIRQTLQDAATSVRDYLAAPAPLRETRLEGLGGQLGADLMVYDGGALAGSSAPVLEELGLVDRYLPPEVYGAVVAGDEFEVTADGAVAGRPTRIGYRNLGVLGPRIAVLAAPRLVEDAALAREERDLAFGLVLVTLAGLVAAFGLANVAARSLSRPVRALREAAERVGRGETPPPFGPDMPGEFVPVMEAFERMARDVGASHAALEAQRRRTATVLRNVATGVVALDGGLRVRIANPRAEELLGISLPMGTAVAAETGAEWMEVWEFVRTAGTGDRGSGIGEDTREFTVREREMRVQVAPLGDEGGWVVALDDTTDLTRAVRVLAWGELARQIAHEIKNPLTPIRLGIQHLRRAYQAPRGDYAETLEQTGRQILAEIERLDAIARAFSRFGAPPAGAEPLAAVDVLTVARDVAALYTLGEGASIDVRGERAVFAAARRDELKEVLINLVENARNAGAAAITVSIEDGLSGGARLAVHDNGRGIAPEHLPRIFEPQFSTTTSGSGLGLAICKRLVESWGGTIRAESELGRGTRVVLELVEAADGGR